MVGRGTNTAFFCHQLSRLHLVGGHDIGTSECSSVRVDRAKALLCGVRWNNHTRACRTMLTAKIASTDRMLYRAKTAAIVSCEDIERCLFDCMTYYIDPERIDNAYLPSRT